MTTCFVRFAPLKRPALSAMGRHAMGVDKSAKKRRVAERPFRAMTLESGLILTHEHGDAALDVYKDFQKWETTNRPVPHKRGEERWHPAWKHVKQRKGAPVVAHWILGVSPGWVQDAGNPHDKDNPRVRQLAEAAVRWAREHDLGDVLQIRYDLDEKGSAICDMFTVPTAKHATTGVPYIAVNAAHLRLAKRHKRAKSLSFRVLQDTWARELQRIDPTIERGKSRVQTAREHVQPEDWGEAVELEIAAARADVERQRLAVEENFGHAMVAQAMAGKTLLDAREREAAVEKEAQAVKARRQEAEATLEEEALAVEAQRKEAKATLEEALAVDARRKEAIGQAQRAARKTLATATSTRREALAALADTRQLVATLEQARAAAREEVGRWVSAAAKK